MLRIQIKNVKIQSLPYVPASHSSPVSTMPSPQRAKAQSTLQASGFVLLLAGPVRILEIMLRTQIKFMKIESPPNTYQHRILHLRLQCHRRNWPKCSRLYRHPAPCYCWRIRHRILPPVKSKCRLHKWHL